MENGLNKNLYERRKTYISYLPIIFIIIIFIIGLSLLDKISSNTNFKNVTNIINKYLDKLDENDEEIDENIDLITNINSIKNIKDYSSDTLIDDMETINFGTYPINDISGKTKEPIEWIVLEKNNNDALLLSKYIIDCKCYNNEFKDITWENCDLRKFLNDDFYNEAFNDDERKKIQNAKILNTDNEEYKTVGGNDTYDKIFCLSIDEIKKYFGSGKKVNDGFELDKNVSTKATNYAKNIINNGSKLFVSSENDWYNGNSSYWLRSPGYFKNCSSCILENGFLDISNMFQGVGYCEYGVRPALYIKW